MEGEVVFFRIFDLGASVELDEVREAMPGLPLEPRLLGDRAMPPYINLPEPIVVAIDQDMVDTNLGPRTLDVTAKLYGVGAVAVVMRIPFQAKALGDLRALHDIEFRTKAGPVGVGEYAARTFTSIVADLKPFLREPYSVASVAEAYTTFCIGTTEPPAEGLRKGERQAVAALLANEGLPERLSDAQVEDAWRYSYQYYVDDLVVVDTDAALVVEPSGRYEDTLAALELANLQLLELRTYDLYLDQILGKAYDDLEVYFSRRGLLRRGSRILKELGNLRMDIAEMTDAAENVTKFIGDFFLAKVYTGCKRKIDLDSWIARVNAKQSALSEIYDTAQRAVEARRTLLLELLVVLLFVLDVVFIAFRIP